MVLFASSTTLCRFLKNDPSADHRQAEHQQEHQADSNRIRSAVGAATAPSASEAAGVCIITADHIITDDVAFFCTGAGDHVTDEALPCLSMARVNCLLDDVI